MSTQNSTYMKFISLIYVIKTSLGFYYYCPCLFKSLDKFYWWEKLTSVIMSIQSNIKINISWFYQPNVKKPTCCECWTVRKGLVASTEARLIRFSAPQGAWSFQSCTSYTFPLITSHRPPSLNCTSMYVFRILKGNQTKKNYLKNRR